MKLSLKGDYFFLSKPTNNLDILLHPSGVTSDRISFSGLLYAVTSEAKYSLLPCRTPAFTFPKRLCVMASFRKPAFFNGHLAHRNYPRRIQLPTAGLGDPYKSSRELQWLIYNFPGDSIWQSAITLQKRDKRSSRPGRPTCN